MIGSMIKTGLSSVGVTHERVTAVAQMIGLLKEGESCGCGERARCMDKKTHDAKVYLSRAIEKISLRRITVPTIKPVEVFSDEGYVASQVVDRCVTAGPASGRTLTVNRYGFFQMSIQNVLKLVATVFRSANPCL